MITRISGYSDKDMLEYCERLERVQVSYMNKEFVSSKANNKKIEGKRFRGDDKKVLSKISESVEYYSALLNK